MFLSQDSHGYRPFVPYFQFAEPFPAGVTVAYAEPVLVDDELANAAENLREAEIEAVSGEASHEALDSRDMVNEFSSLDVIKSMKLTRADLESMSIDEVRAMANVLDIPGRGTITEKAELVEEVLRRVWGTRRQPILCSKRWLSPLAQSRVMGQFAR
jgi:hypothetical protein